MTTIALIIAIAAVSVAIYVVRNLSHAANKPCNGEEETLEEIDKLLKRQT